MSASSDPAFATFVALLIDTLTSMVPGDDDNEETRHAIARLMFDAFQPRDAIEAMSAARAVAAHHAAMDNFARAAQPGVSDEKVIRLRANALAAGRSVEAALRALEKRRNEKPAPAEEEAASPPAPVRLDPRAPLPGRRPAPIAPAARPDLHASTSLTSARTLEPVLART